MEEHRYNPKIIHFSRTGSKKSDDHRINIVPLQSTLRRLALNDICERDFRGSWLNVVAKCICNHSIARTIRSQLHNHCVGRSHRSEETVFVLSNLHGHWIGVTGFAQHIQRAFDRIHLHSNYCILIHHLRRIVWHFAIELCDSRRNNAKEGKALVILECDTPIKCEVNFQIKNVANSTCMTLLWGMATLILQIYPTLSATLGMHTCMFFFAASCFFLAAFTLVFIPETKGKSYETIMRALEKRKDSKSGAEHIGVEKQ